MEGFRMYVLSRTFRESALFYKWVSKKKIWRNKITYHKVPSLSDKYFQVQLVF